VVATVKNAPSQTGSLREIMPTTAAFIDQMRDVFGAADVNAAIKSGLNGQETFYAAEAGLTLGTKGTGCAVPITPRQEPVETILARIKRGRA
jgi:hypothetical protein